MLALLSKWPTLDLRLVRSPETGAASRTWCFHEGDLRPSTLGWLKPLITKEWQGYDVTFPAHQRSVESKYFAIASDAFFPQTDELLASNFATQRRTDADFTIFTTGWPKLRADSECGWQKFVGLDVTIEKPHGLSRPILMDATVEQTDGFRFVYCLPWSPTSLLIEDTYYSDTPELEFEATKSEVLKYAKTMSWKVASIDRTESGSLPLAFSSNSASEAAGDVKSVSLGAASGLAHPVTGYTTSILFRQIEALSGVASPTADLFLKAVRRENGEIEKSFSYLYLLNRMMFRASEPGRRYKVLERFYTLSPELISRFYACNLTAADRARILVGRPPVPILKAAQEFAKWSMT